MQTYECTISEDFTNGFDIAILSESFKNSSLGSIFKSLRRNGDTLVLKFTRSLITSEGTTRDNIVSNHNPSVLSSISSLMSNLTATTDPTTSDDINQGYNIGSFWINISTPQAFICCDDTATSAVWKAITS